LNETEQGPRRVEVRSARGPYDVLVGRGLLGSAGQHITERLPDVRRWAVIADDHVAPLYGGRVRAALEERGCDASLFAFPAGEQHKTRGQWQRLTDALLAAELGRDAGVVAVGGGVTGDLAGFVAATYMRGIPVVQVATSIVAMVDSSVGGKTGVDTPAGKNLVGAFHPPGLVLIDPDVVATLPRTERAQGWAEAVKHGAILDRPYFDELAASAPELLAGDADATERAVRRSVELKARVVSDDEREGGLREVLNFGHTLGHALEAASDYTLPHGSAVSVGMVLEARLGERMGVTKSGTANHLAGALERFELPTTFSAATPSGELEGYLRRDKKVRAGRVRMVLLQCVGEVANDGHWSREVAIDSSLDVIDTYGADAGV
jgi:3-dehydroquinate synthase